MKHRALVGAVLALLLAFAQSGALSHAYAHVAAPEQQDPDKAPAKGCALDAVYAELGHALGGDALPQVQATAHVSAAAFPQSSTFSAAPRACRARGPPESP